MRDRKAKIIQEIHRLVQDYFVGPSEVVSDEICISLGVPSFSWEEINEAIDSLVLADVTMGAKVQEFERKFARYLGAKHAVMVNSGSSANLIALSILTNLTIKNRIQPGEEVIVPGVTWSTTIFPVVNVGASPVLVDINLDDYTMDLDSLKKAITHKTRAIMPVHLLGNPCQMDEILEIAKAYDLFVIEDACEAHGSQINHKKVGTFGDIGTFSFFFSHHISTIEGGMIVTNNDGYAELAKTLRAHGWIRELSNREEIAFKYPHINGRYLFVNLGYNLRPTEIQGAFGIHQIDKLERFIEIRRKNADEWSLQLALYSDFLALPSIEEPQGVRRVWFGYPIRVKPEAPFSREELTGFLESRKIQTRPIMAGNLAQQPVIQLLPHRVAGSLRNCEKVMAQAFFLGNHHGIGEAERAYVVQCFHEFMSRYQ